MGSSSSEVEKASTSTAMNNSNVPRYGERAGFKPSKPEDFGSGGAFPELPFAQYPLGMGLRPASSNTTLALTTSVEGKPDYTALVHTGRIGSSSGEVNVFSRASSAVPVGGGKRQIARPTRDNPQIMAQAAATEALLMNKSSENKTPAGFAALQNPGNAKAAGQAEFVSYLGAKSETSRLVRVSEAPIDPLEPSKFKGKKVPRGPPEPPVPILADAAPKVTQQDLADWKIPPVVSQWKNNKGYTVALDKRILHDGRAQVVAAASDRFANLAESLYLAEKAAREEVSLRNKLAAAQAEKERQQKEEALRTMAREARQGGGIRRGGSSPPGVRGPHQPGAAYSMGGYHDNDDYEEAEEAAEEEEEKEEKEEEYQDKGDEEEFRRREATRRERERERLRESRMEKSGKKRGRSEAERDISEKIALGMTVNGAGGGNMERTTDARLFAKANHSSHRPSLEHEDALYDQPLFTARSESIYKPVAHGAAAGGSDETMGEATLAAVNKRRNAFLSEATAEGRSTRGVEAQQGENRGGKREEGPVQFERASTAKDDEEEEDVFGLESFLAAAKKQKQT